MWLRVVREGTMCVAIVTGLVGSGVGADRMVSVVPRDGVTRLVKVFYVGAGTMITGAQFESDGAATVFPVVELVRGPLDAINVANVTSVANVLSANSGIVSITWSQPVAVTTSGTYYVAICMPTGPGKLGLNTVASPNGSYITCGPERSLLPIRGELALTLLTNPRTGAFKASMSRGEEPARAMAYLHARAVLEGARVEFGVEESARVVLVVYDAAGRMVRELVRGPFTQGRYEWTWDGRGASGESVGAGVYFVQLRAGSRIFSDKLVMLR